MSVGRIVSGVAASAAVAGCAVLAVGMSRAGGPRSADGSPDPAPSAPSYALFAPHFVPPRSSAPVTRAPTGPSSVLAPAPASTTAARTGAAHRPVASVPTRPAARHPAPRAAATSTTAKAPAPVRGQSLPVRYSTGTATRVITVTAHSTGSTTATLQAWTKAPGGGWLRYGIAVTAHVGADGLSTAPSEYRSATPIGSFSLTQAFGYYSDPGTALPYLQTTPSDWWISQAGPLYNTHQRCSSGCSFTQGSPNEHLYYETPFYNYAVVIDYNTRNAPGGVRQGAGSAFFLHVTDGHATAGCVAIAQSNLISLMRWLTPSAHPRILIGVG